MNRAFLAASCLSLGLLLGTGCSKPATAQPSAGAGTGPTPSTVEPDLDANNFKVAHPERFPLATAGEHIAAPELNATGVVNPDVSRQVPVPSLATGRIVEINGRLGDEVKKGQLLFKVRSTDVSGAYSDYRQAIKNEELTKIQLTRAKLLFDDGAIPKSALEIAQNAEDNNIVVLETTKEHLLLLGVDPDHPTGIVEVFAPVSGTITDQQITNQSGVQALTPPNPFTISDLSRVWIVCDVYENNMAQVHIGEYADIHLVAYPNRVLKGRISNILPIVDPNIRTAKVRLEVDNPGLMRLGMFVTATFKGQSAERHATLPATAILHLHDREWVYTPLPDGRFRRLEVTAGGMLPGGMQEIIDGIKPGDRVISNALVFQNTVEQ
ncbi:MAG TPA: efflux RND transporter periplasmic adaptor subunit [Bryobacteraceae bacterium]|jgi:cobalt-zinc-cadmium efflux system membrane fusion protein|nr:efflux RND transporter periplasmic adaptor subunit [Bryobacteraceae bacterium]